MISQPSALVVASFVILPLIVAVVFVAACSWVSRRLSVAAATGVIAWLAVTALAARSGLLARFELRPPPFAILVLCLFAIAISVAFSGAGSRLARDLPLWALVGFQLFRLPLELSMHQAYTEGLMPVQMSYSGYNFDILTGITAAALAVWLFVGRPPRWIVLLWNLLGSTLLAVIIVIAILCTPIVRAFGDEHLNIFVAYFPFVWLPAVLVTAALLGHLLLWRRLASRNIVQPS